MKRTTPSPTAVVLTALIDELERSADAYDRMSERFGEEAAEALESEAIQSAYRLQRTFATKAATYREVLDVIRRERRRA